MYYFLFKDIIFCNDRKGYLRYLDKDEEFNYD